MKRLLLILAISVLSVNLVAAQDNETVLGIATDKSDVIPIDQFAYFLFTDGTDGFSIVKTNSEVLVGINTVTFTRTASAVENVADEKVNVSVYPNPVATQLTLRGLQGENQVRIFAIDGALMYETVIKTTTGSIDVSNLASGMYILQVNETSIKFIKK